MKVFEYIVLSLALALPVLLTLRDCAAKVHLRLTRGLLVSFIIAVEQALLVLLGMLMGNLLRLGIPEYDNLVFLGLMLVVALRMFFNAFRKPKEKDAVVFDISRLGTVALLGLATGTNTLFVGIGLGFRTLLEHDIWAVSVPMAVSVFLLGYLGIMMGRQGKELRRRRWLLIATLFLLLYAIKGVVDA